MALPDRSIQQLRGCHEQGDGPEKEPEERAGQDAEGKARGQAGKEGQVSRPACQTADEVRRRPDLAFFGLQQASVCAFLPVHDHAALLRDRQALQVTGRALLSA